MRPPTLTVIVAARDEEETIERCLRRIDASLGDRPREILVIDGGTDRTGAIVRALSTDIPCVRHVPNVGDRGKGHAIRRGGREARAPVMVQIDADLQFLPEELPRLLEPIEAGRADVVLGSRFMAGSTRRPGSTTPLRTFGNKLASLYASGLFAHRMTDVQAGMKAWTREAFERIRFASDDYSYEVEIPARALRAGFRVVDVPISTDARAGGQTKVHVVRDGIPLLWDITRFRMQRPR